MTQAERNHGLVPTEAFLQLPTISLDYTEASCRRLRQQTPALDIVKVLFQNTVCSLRAKKKPRPDLFVQVSPSVAERQVKPVRWRNLQRRLRPGRAPHRQPC
jgi:hypothetical protein